MSLRRHFRDLIAAPQTLLMPGAYDALSAKIMESSGCQAIMAGGYAAIGSLLAEADSGQSNMRDMAEHYGRIVRAVGIPVYIDADTGFGGVHNIRQMVRTFEATGAAGLFFSDQVFPNRCGYLPGKEVVSSEVMLARIGAALDARSDADFFIGTRTDSLSLIGLDAAIERCQMFMEAGADMAKPQGADRREEIQRAITDIPGPHFATLSQAAGAHPTGLEGMRDLGVAAVTMPSIGLFAAAQGVLQTIQELMSTNSTSGLGEKLIPLADYYDLVGLKDLQDKERRYDVAAAAIIARRKRLPT